MQLVWGTGGTQAWVVGLVLRGSSFVATEGVVWSVEKTTSWLQKIPGGESSFSGEQVREICPLVNEGCRRVLSL